MNAFLTIVLALALTPSSVSAAGAAALPPKVDGIGIKQKLGVDVPLQTEFREETGAPVTLAKYFNDKPVLLAPVYFTCPMLCSQILSGVVSGLRPLSLKPGRDFEIVALSFDPHDTPSKAAEERKHYSSSYSSRAGISGWHFLTGNQKNIDAVMKAIGFSYRWDEPHKMFVHASGVMILTAQGRVSRYLYGVEYEPKDLKLSLMESSLRRIGSPADQVLLLCYHYDPKTGKYGPLVINLMRLFAVLTLVALGVAMFFWWRRDLRQHRRRLNQPAHL